jgi:peptide/nickel transport system permease protein
VRRLAHSFWMLPPSARLGAAILAVVFGVALVSLVWTPYDKSVIDMDQRLAPPLTAGHLLGTDQFGRDVITLLMNGAANTIYFAIVGAGAAFLVGLLIAVIAVVHRGGWIEEILMRSADIVYALPAILIALILVSTVGPGRETAILAVMIWFAPVVARVARSAALTIVGNGYVLAARTYGRGPYYTMVRHVLPNIASILLVQASVTMVVAVLLEASLSYLGVGTQPPDVSWGRMLRESQSYVGQSIWLVVWPGMAIALTVIGLNLLGDGLRDRIDQRVAQTAL